ncbi:MAG: methylated-DNA-protein-cysteine methyltransferase-like protein, partial [Cyclobacteriaceae bacterium]
PTMMQEMLETEGVKIKNDKVQQLDKVYWEPIKELI